MPRGQCMLWEPDVVGAYVIGEVGTFLSYLLISIGFIRLSRRADLTKTRLLEFASYLFAAFIGVCGVDHLLSAVAVWWPAYTFLAAWKVLLMVVSMTAAAFFVPVVMEITRVKKRDG